VFFWCAIYWDIQAEILAGFYLEYVGSL
jgi:hypothetical protein